MIEGLRYNYDGMQEGRDRRGSLELAAPKDLMDRAGSSWAPMLGSTTQQVLTRSFDGQGGMTLKFDYDRIGRGYTGQPEIRANNVFNIVTQVSSVAQRAGLGDPRISIGNEISANGKWTRFGVSFDRPQGVDDEELAERLQAGMLQSAALLRLHRRQDIDQQNISVYHFEKRGFAIRARGLEKFPLLTTDMRASADAHRIELSGESRFDDKTENHARLIALTSIISVLDPLE